MHHLTVVAAALALWAPSASAQSSTPPASAADSAISTLYSVQAQGGTLRATGKATYRLTLRGLARDVTAFTDRPVRRASLHPTRELARYWSRLFGNDPPNAALTLTKPSRRPFAGSGPKRTSQDTIILELRSPKYRSKGNTLTFDARRIVSSPHSLEGLNPRAADYHPPEKFGEAALFIDDESNAVTDCFIQIDNHTGNVLTHQTDWSAADTEWLYGPTVDTYSAVDIASGPTAMSLVSSTTGYPATVARAAWGYFLQQRLYSGWSFAAGGCLVNLQMGYDAANYISVQVGDYDEYGTSASHCTAAGVFVCTMTGLTRYYVSDQQGNPITTAVFTITEAQGRSQPPRSG